MGCALTFRTYSAPVIFMNDNNEFSTQNISPTLISQIVEALRNKGWGSIEIYIENHQVVQITERKITKIKTTNQQNEISKMPRINRFQLKIQKY